MDSINKKEFVIFSQHLAGWLMMKGFVLLSSKPSNKNNNRNVFFFRETKSLLKSIEDYKQLQQNNQF